MFSSRAIGTPKFNIRFLAAPLQLSVKLCSILTFFQFFRFSLEANEIISFLLDETSLEDRRASYCNRFLISLADSIDGSLIYEKNKLFLNPLFKAYNFLLFLFVLLLESYDHRYRHSNK